MSNPLIFGPGTGGSKQSLTLNTNIFGEKKQKHNEILKVDTEFNILHKTVFQRLNKPLQFFQWIKSTYLDDLFR